MNIRFKRSDSGLSVIQN